MRRGFNAFSSSSTQELKDKYLATKKQRHQGVNNYFEQDDLEDEVEKELQQEVVVNETKLEGVDPLDAFMNNIDQQMKSEAKQRPSKRIKPAVLDNEEDQMIEELQQHAKNEKNQVIHYDSDEQVYATAKAIDDKDQRFTNPQNGKKAVIEVLEKIDHSKVNYEPFEKRFYTPHSDIQNMAPATAIAWQKQHEIAVVYSSPEKPIYPIHSFAHAGFDPRIIQALVKEGFKTPTAIQSQSFPVIMSGNDVIGIAKTGSGKTLSFVLPMIHHIMDQRELESGDGPISLILSPTRELAHQIYLQCRKFASAFSLRCLAIYGGSSKWEQQQALQKGVEVVIGTPGRMIEMIKKKALVMTRITFLILDEADRMFDLGFEPQIRSIVGRIRDDRQTLLFSATFRRKIEDLAREILNNPVRITVGKFGQANKHIQQIALVIPGNTGKWPWLISNLPEILEKGKVLIFVNGKAGVDELSQSLKAKEFFNTSIHGDKSQYDRHEAIKKFKTGQVSIIIATDVASRGLDIKNIGTVVNFDVPKNIETHIHRIGRTGRMGADGAHPGCAYTLVTPGDAFFAGDLVNHMDISNQSVPESLVNLAMQNREFHRRRTPVLASNHASSRIAVESSAVQDQGELLPAHKTGQKGRHGLGFKTGDEFNSSAYRATSSSFVRASTAPSSQRDTSNRQTLVICPPKKEQKNSAQSIAIVVEKKQLDPSPSNSSHQNDAVKEALAKINARIKGSSSEGRQQNDDEKRNSRTFVADDHRRGTRRRRSRSPASSKSRSRSRRRYSGRQRRRSYSSSSSPSSSDESSSNYHRKRYRHQKRSRS